MTVLASPPVSRETLDRLDGFVALLLRWNARINLVGERDAAAIWARHVEDSLQLVPLLPPGDGPIGDLGSGAGFPGLVLALVSERPTYLIEADRRKAAFLMEAVRMLELANVTVLAERIEDAALPPLAVVTARALAPLAVLLAHAERLLAPSGVALFPKGRTAEAELTGLGADWMMRVERVASRTDPAATILRLSGISRVRA